jgi:hypothetical protein
MLNTAFVEAGIESVKKSVKAAATVRIDIARARVLCMMIFSFSKRLQEGGHCYRF